MAKKHPQNGTRAILENRNTCVTLALSHTQLSWKRWLHSSAASLRVLREGIPRDMTILWMVAKSILHHLRNPGMIRFPNANTNNQWFPMVAKWCRISSTHSISEIQLRTLSHMVANNFVLFAARKTEHMNRTKTKKLDPRTAMHRSPRRGRTFAINTSNRKNRRLGSHHVVLQGLGPNYDKSRLGDIQITSLLCAAVKTSRTWAFLALLPQKSRTWA